MYPKKVQQLIMDHELLYDPKYAEVNNKKIDGVKKLFTEYVTDERGNVSYKYYT
jgi:hypothetical protein